MKAIPIILSMTSYIVGSGAALPQQVISNKDLSIQLGASAEAIEKKTGIVTRHWVSNGETTASLAIDAARMALQSAHLLSSAIDAIIVSTSSPEMFFPSVACFVQSALGCKPVPAFDVNASCSGFLYALSVGDQLIRGGAENVLVIASEVKSIYLDRENIQTVSLFGDGAGAMILSRTNRIGRGSQAGREIRSIKIFSGGPKEQLITLPAGGSRLPLSDDTLSQNLHVMKMHGTRVFRLAVRKMDEALSCLLNENGIPLQEIDLFIFHQANMRILNTVLKKKGISSEKHHTTIRKFGNTSSSSLPIAYDDAVRHGKIKSGAKICLCTFGGGFTWGAALIGG